MPQQRIHEEQNELDATVKRDVFSQIGETQRVSKLENVELAWRSINDTVKSDIYVQLQSMLDATEQYCEDQPALSASSLRPQKPFNDIRGNIDLVEVVKDSEALIRMARHRLTQSDFKPLINTQDHAQVEDILRETNGFIATLATMTDQLQRLLVRIKDSNEVEARGLYIQMAAASIKDVSPFTLCPPTPAQQDELVRSLKEIPMRELSNFVADTVRKSARKKNQEWLESDHVPQEPNISSTTGVFRTLQYDDGISDDDNDDGDM